MREYILTEKEKEVLQRYVEKGEKLEGFAVLVHRCRNMQGVNDDLKLIKQFLSKVESAK